METRENTGPPCNTQIHAHLFLFNLTASTTFALWLLLAIWLDGTAVASSATISYQSILHLSGHSGETLNTHTHISQNNKKQQQQRKLENNTHTSKTFHYRFNVAIVFSTGLKELDAVLLGQVFTFLLGHHLNKRF
jgi:hypothetical protein